MLESDCCLVDSFNEPLLEGVSRIALIPYYSKTYGIRKEKIFDFIL